MSKQSENSAAKASVKGIALMLICATCLALGQLIWKFYDVYGVVALLAGFAVYGFGALAMIFAYRYGELSVLQPLNSFSYVVSLALGAAVLHESVTAPKYAGVALILIGLILISGGKRS